MKKNIITAITMAMLSGCGPLITQTVEIGREQAKRQARKIDPELVRLTDQLGTKLMYLADRMEQLGLGEDPRAALPPKENITKRNLEFSDAAIAEGFGNRIPYDTEVDRLEAQVEGTGQAITIYNESAESNRSVQRRTAGTSPQ